MPTQPKKLNYKLKLWVKKKMELSGGWKQFRPVEWILIDEYSQITTEVQLCKYVYERHGEGRYLILAWAPKNEGFWAFWLGELYSNGFVRDINKNKELENLKLEMNKAQSYEEKADLEEEMNFEKEIFNETKKFTKRGPIGLKSSRPGILHSYYEEDRNGFEQTH